MSPHPVKRSVLRLVPLLLLFTLPALAQEFPVVPLSPTTWTFGSDVSALPGQGFLVVWGQQESDGDGLGIQGRYLASDAGPSGSAFQVNSHTTGRQGGPEVVVNSAGEAFVVWSSESSPGTDDGYAILGRRFSDDGTPSGSDMQMNTWTTSSQRNPRISQHADGRTVASWESWDAADSARFQRFNAAGLPVGTDTLLPTGSRWQHTTLVV